MKKVLSMILVMAMLALCISVPVFAAGTGTGSDPYLINNTDAQATTITIPAETEIWVKVNNANGSLLTVTSASHTEYFLWYCKQTFNSATTLEFIAGADMVSINNIGEEALTISLKLTGGAEDPYGTLNFPDPIELVANPYSGALGAYVTEELAASNEGYYYSVTAPQTGVITVDISAFDADFNDIGWMFFVNNVTAEKYGSYNYSDDENSVNSINVPVTAGDELLIFATTYNPQSPWNNPAGSIGVNLSFSPVGSNLCPKEITAGSHSYVAEADSQGYTYKWTATESGTVVIAVSGSAWQYSVNGILANGNYIYGETHWSDDEVVVASETHTVNAGDALTIWVNTYDANSFSAPAGTVNWSLSFSEDMYYEPGPDLIDPPTDPEPIDPDANYLLSDGLLALGTATYVVDGSYEYTVFAFEPAETGKYTISSDNALIGLVSTNGMWITVGASTAVIESEFVSANTFDWTCTSVGQSIWVAVKAPEASANITVAYEEVEIKTIPREYYVNTVTPAPFVFNGNADALEYVDTFDGICDSAVLGADGYYHLNTADGPILFANIADPIMSLASANDYGQLKELIYENGEVVMILDFTMAMIDYIECMDENSGLYPLTADLIAVFSQAGTSLGWYGADGWIGGEDGDEWMFACYYDANVTSLDGTPGTPDSDDNANNDATPDNGTDNEVHAPATSDNTALLAVAVFLTLIAFASLVVLKKRSTN